MKYDEIDFSNLPRCNGKSGLTFEQFQKLWLEKVFAGALEVMHNQAREQIELEQKIKEANKQTDTTTKEANK